MAQRLAAIFFFTTVVLGLALFGFWRYVNELTLTLPVAPTPKPVDNGVPPVHRVSPLLVDYRLDTPGRGELFPALTTAAAADYWPVAILTITNTGKSPTVQVITAEIPGYSRELRQTVVVAAKATATVRITPELLPAAFQLGEIAHSRLHVQVLDDSGTIMFAQSRPILIHSGNDLYWGKQFGNAQLVARWVTPHDPAVLKLVSDAHQFIRNGRMPGYNINERQERLLPAQVKRQAEAVFEALKRSGFSYVSSIYTFGGFAGEAQRIRLPRETLQLDSANCMDISVAFASAIENLDMDPVLVIIPGHAFTGVRLGPQSTDILYLDLTVLPKGTFAQAAARARHWLKKTNPNEVLTIDVAAARKMGIYPLPTVGAAADSSVATETQGGPEILLRPPHTPERR
ncbi:MAG TPA: hypothetical protein VFU86_07335 [Terriglobales bacterium]|nr:hypothetical protein [Terriglobales bacterium]